MSKSTKPDSKAIKEQIEYYLSDKNLKKDNFFHNLITGNKEGWIDVSVF
jgi:hypothetical protein